MSRAIAFSPDGLAKFLGRMEQATAMAVAAADADPERAIWTPGTKTFFIPETPIYRRDFIRAVAIGAAGLLATELLAQATGNEPLIVVPERFCYTQMTKDGVAALYYKADGTLGRVLVDGQVVPDTHTRLRIAAQVNSQGRMLRKEGRLS